MTFTRIATTGFIACFFLSACNGAGARNGPLPLTPSQNSKYVAVYGDNQLELREAIAAASAAGKIPVYVEITAPKKRYVFPVYAQILRTKHGLVVRAYERVYAYVLNQVSVRIRGERISVPAQALPSVPAPNVELLASAVPPPTGKFQFGDTAAKARVCPDCVLILARKRAVRAFGQRWEALQDPWQRNPEYVAWSPAASMKPMANLCPNLVVVAPGGSACPYSGIPSAPGAASGPSGGPVATLPRSEACGGALPVGYPLLNGGHSNSISNVFVDSIDVGGAIETVGYEYQTFGGKEYWQFGGSFSVGLSGGIAFVSVSIGGSVSAPLVPYNGNLTTDLSETLNALGDGGDSPVGILATIIKDGMGHLAKADCYSGKGA